MDAEAKKNKPLGWKWHKFLVNFLIFASAVGGFVYAAFLVRGIVLELCGNSPFALYSMLPGAAAADSVYAFILAVLGIYKIIVRQRLAHFRRLAPFMYCLSLFWTCGLM